MSASDKQRTIKESVSLSGVGLHSGKEVHITFKPAEIDGGLVFVRTDLPGRPVIKVNPDYVDFDPEITRCTLLRNGDAVISTVEHALSALNGLGIDNIIMEIDGEELPGLDGSAIGYWEALHGVGTVEQDAPKAFYAIKEPITVSYNGAAISIVPHDSFKVSYTLHYDHPWLRSQFYETVLNETDFGAEIAPCRTFCLEKEAALLHQRGLGRGANYTNTLVVGDRGVIDNALRFDDEFARHKVLDCIGDLYLLGMRIQGHVIAYKTGHASNRLLLKKIYEQKKKYESRGIVPGYVKPTGREFNIEDIQKILPHRYPFLLVDRVVEVEPGRKGVGYKNVTINDGFFQGHFPTKPVMPGVLILEAMAQTGGVIGLTGEAHRDKLALFLSVNSVKFRRMVVPGDQLVMEVEIIRDRAKMAQIRGVAKVDGEVAAEADMMFTFMDHSFLD